MPKYTSIFLCLVLLFASQGCRMHHAPVPQTKPEFRAPTEQENEEWVAKQELLPVSEADIAQARTTQVRLVNHRVDSPDGRVRLVFYRGDLLTLGSPGHHTTTSYYQFIDIKSGELLARVESKLSKQWARERSDQKIFFSSDGQAVLIYESLTDGDQCVGTNALLRWHPEEKSWKLTYLDLPMHSGLPWREEDPIPAGVLGDTIVFDAVKTGRFHKMKLSDIPETHKPLPFWVG